MGLYNSSFFARPDVPISPGQYGILLEFLGKIFSFLFFYIAIG